MAVPVSVKEELHALIDAMDSRTAIRTLAMLSLLEDDGELTDDEIEAIREAEEDMRAGRTVRGADLEREFGFTE